MDEFIERLRTNFERSRRGSPFELYIELVLNHSKRKAVNNKFYNGSNPIQVMFYREICTDLR